MAPFATFPAVFAVAVGLSLPLCSQARTDQKPAPDLSRKRAFAIELGPGPVVCFERNSPGTPHQVSIYATNCDGDQKARRFWINSGNADVVARLDQSHILVASYGEPYGLIVVDTKTGSHHLLAEGSSHSFVAQRREEVLFLGDNRWGKGDNHLYARNWRTLGARRKLAEPTFASVPLIEGNLAIGVTAGERQVWAISLARGKGRKVYELPQGASQTRLTLAPNGLRLAIGTSINWRGHLAVVDLGAAKVLNRWDGLNISLSPLSSFSPTVECNWFDDEHVVSSETIGQGRNGGHFAWVRRNVATGKITDESAYGPMVLRHTRPPRAGAEPAPQLFSIATEGDRLLLMQQGKKEPVQSVPKDYRHGAKIRLSPDGRFAIVHLERDPRLCQLYRPGLRPLAVSDAGALEWRWLPAIRTVESQSK